MNGHPPPSRRARPPISLAKVLSCSETTGNRSSNDTIPTRSPDVLTTGARLTPRALIWLIASAIPHVSGSVSGLVVMASAIASCLSARPPHNLRADDIPIGDDADRAHFGWSLVDDDQSADVALMHLRDCICQRIARPDDVDLAAAHLSNVHNPALRAAHEYRLCPDARIRTDTHCSQGRDRAHIEMGLCP